MSLNHLKLNVILILVLFAGVSCQTVTKEKNYALLVNSTLGSKGKGFGVEQRYLEAGYTFPGPMLPFGMVQFTTTFFDENKGFVINQMSGAGCHNMGNLPMLPIPGELKESPIDMMSFKPEIKLSDAHAGYYEANLFNQINCELSTTTRTGIARIHFDESQKGTILIGTGINSTEVSESSVKITGPNSFEGVADGGNFCGANSNYKIYFAGEFSKEADASGTWMGDSLLVGQTSAQDNNSGVYFSFENKDSSAILYKVGISYVSLDNAKLNLKTENPNWDFDQVKEQAEKEWNQVLSIVDVEGASQDKIIQFYSHMYHSFAHPSVFNDVNGEYIGADFEIHTSEDGDYYTAFSNWDTYRTQIQLLSMLVPEKASQMVSSMLTFAEQSGGGLPRWVCANFETGIMQGDPTTALIANAYAFGAKNFDTAKALEIMRKGAEVPGTMSQRVETRQHLDQYLNDGFISSSMGSSMLLEYTSSDFAIAQFAKKAFNDEDLYNTYLERSRKWKNIYNPETTWLQSRFEDGSWKPQNHDWREASYKNYFWMVPYDLKCLTDTIGGAEVAEKRLDEFFTKLNANYHEEFFAAGNEPSFQSPWTYNWIGKPNKTQEIVRRIINEQYSNRDCGLPGNDDMGAMAAWYVFADMGLYPMVPGVAGFSLNGPSFEQIKINLGNGNVLTIKGGSEQNIYVDGLTVNDQKWESTWLPYNEIENGCTLQFKMAASPSQWGVNQLPPSFNEFK
ncbi:GH92 family glycosyl hydrolase [Sunxiuqinia sp. A32]|uniref:GH92 family glycosyl hydrolase n=1 Tax=Sunxiuqinia sp. A32 TaxID=3461496 RepID=UPI00404563D4